MVLALKVPHDDAPQALLKPWPVFLSDVLSVLCVGLYWNNHHHLLPASQTISADVLWANLHLLLWLSLLHHGRGHAIETALAVISRARPHPSLTWWAGQRPGGSRPGSDP